MTIRRVVPDITSKEMEGSRRFYTEFLGFSIGMDMGWIMTFVSPANPTAQLTVVAEQPVPHSPSVSIEVDDIDAVHAKALTQGIPIVYPLTTEPWGVRRFFVIDPNGVVINIMSHLKKDGS